MIALARLLLVSLSPSCDPIATGTGPCFIPLGGSDGTYVYWYIDGRQGVRISDATVIAAAPC